MYGKQILSWCWCCSGYVLVINAALLASAGFAQQRRPNPDETVAKTMYRVWMEDDHSWLVVKNPLQSLTLEKTGISYQPDPKYRLKPMGIDAQTDAASSRIQGLVRAVAGESLSPQENLQVDWLVNVRMARHKDRIREYEGRCSRIDKKLLLDWQSAQARLGVQQELLTHVYLGVLFLEPLWHGSDWKSGNPQKALTRMNSLSGEWVKKWAKELGFNGSSQINYILRDEPTDYSFDSSFLFVNLIVVIDGLFKGDAFDSELFARAYPMFHQLWDPKAPVKKN
jgi:hypothetical protein